MADTEEYFPRGGKKPTTTYFKQSGNFLGAAEKGERKKKKPKKKAEGDDGYLSDEAIKEISQSVKNCTHGLTYKTIKPGVLILGRVKKILETKVILMLPCRMIGSVMACHISEAYNKILEAYVNDQTEKVRELYDMFRPGQYVAVKVLEVEGESIMLSMMPQHLNAGKKHSELHKGTLLQAAVSSVEDHGYVMDIGLLNTRAFLPKSEANPEVELDSGAVTWCCIKSVTPSSESSVVTLTSSLVSLQRALLRYKPDSSILPGSAVLFTVDAPLDNGIEGHIFQDTTAYIQRLHADRVKGKKKPALGQKITARILYVMPTRNTPFLTMRNIFDTTYPDLGEEQKLKDGAIIEEAQVLKITGRSIHFKLGDGCLGTMSLKRIQVHEDLTDEEIVAKSYPIGSTHKVRVLCYNLSDYVYSVSDQSEVVNEKYFSLDQLSAGEIVDASVKSVDDKNVVLNVGRVTGFVPRSHLSDAGTYVDAKTKKSSKLPTKKFKVGQPIRARVLSLDLTKQILLLTLKPSLLVPDLEVLHSYGQAEVGKAYTGSIKVVREYVLVSFFNSVIAFVPRHYVTKEPIEILSDAFHVGQIVNCTILTVDPEAEKMTGSLTTVPFWPAKKRENFIKRKRDTDDNETPTKKKKTDKDKKKKSKQDLGDDNNIEEYESHDNSDIETNVRTKKKKRKDSEGDSDKEKATTADKKKIKNSEHDLGDGDIENSKSKKERNKKMKKDSEKEFPGFFQKVDENVWTLTGNIQPIMSHCWARASPFLEVNCTILTVDPEAEKMTGSLTTVPFWPVKKRENFIKRKRDTDDNETPTKKKKTDKDKKKKSKQDLGDDNNIEEYESHDNSDIETNVRTKKKKRKDSEGDSDKEKATTADKKKIKNSEHDLGDGDIENSKSKKERNKKMKKDSEKELEEDGDTQNPKSKKVQKKRKNSEQDSEDDGDIELKKSESEDDMEESDLIDTDFADDVEILTPQDLGLIDLSDCITSKQYKKKVVALLKSINAKTNRIDRIAKKIVSIEEKGLNARNKKFHTAMHSEKLVIDERIQKLLDAMKIAQEKLKELGVEANKDYKKKKQKIKEEGDHSEVEKDSEQGSGNIKKRKKDIVKEVKKNFVSDIKVVESLEPALEVPSAKDFWSTTAESLAKNVEEEQSSSSEEEVNCTILTVDPEAEKMTGSFTTVPFWPAKKRENFIKRKRDTDDNETPTKKKKTDKDKKKKSKQDLGDDNNIEEYESHDNSDIETNVRTKKKKRKDSEGDSDKEKATTADKKKIKNSEHDLGDGDIENSKSKKERNKKMKKDSEKELEEDGDTQNPKSKKVQKKRKNSEQDSEDDGDIELKKSESEDDMEESDLIDTDFADDVEILTPQDLGLIDLSDCITSKQYKKKVVALLKSINAKTNRIDRIAKKIVSIEEKGLNARNKKFHTAMHSEKLVIDERIQKLLDAMKIAQEKLKELGVEANKDYKKKKQKIKEEGDHSEVEKDSEQGSGNIKKRKKDIVKEVKKNFVSDIKVVESLEPALEVPSAKDFWSTTAESLAKNVEEEQSSSSEEEEKDQPKKKRKKLSVAEKLAKVREEEERIREMERRAVESSSQPRSTEQFERALLANPSCSQLWIAYMAFHLQATEIEKARAVGRKALNTISFREEDEKLNVWLAMINLENRFGTKETQQRTIEEALQMNDTFKIHSKLLDIYVETSKHQELTSLVDLMIRKYKRNPDTYIMCGGACFKLGLVDKARQVMQKAIGVLEKKEHVGVLVQFALLERNHGARERAEALFEQVLAVYPQRVDVCSVYVDMLVKSGDIEPVRQVMERMTSQKLPARKMKVLFKKWIEVEEKLGHEEQVERIRQRAMEYVEKAKF